MFNNIALNITSNSRVLNNAKNIYNEVTNQNDLYIKEGLINLLGEYNESHFENNKDIWHILFSGKKIKQTIRNKKTLITLDKSPYENIYDEIDCLKSFIISNKVYSINPLSNVIPCDLLFAQGGIFEANEIHTAVFLPYFLDKPTNNIKRTFIFVNILFKRFKEISSRIFDTLGFKAYLEGKLINLTTITANDFARWLLLHEFIHNSGPLPLFSLNVNKFPKKIYGYIEEMRVDLTTIKIIIENIATGKIPHDFYNVIIIIIIERLFRASIYNFNKTSNLKNGMFAKEVEGDAAIALMIILTRYKIFDISNKLLDLNINNLTQITELILSDIYKFEQMAKEQRKFESAHSIFSSFLREKYLPMPPEVHNFLVCNSVQNCQYRVNFIG